MLGPWWAAWVAVCCLLCLILDGFEKTKKLSILSKALASLGLLGFLLTGLSFGPDSPVQIYLWLLAVALAVAGDVLLTFPRTFKPAVLSFLLCHFVYVGALYPLWSPLWLFSGLIWLGLSLGAGLGLKFLLKKRRAPLGLIIGYGGAVNATLVFGAAASGQTPRHVLLVGVLAFWLSDVAVLARRLLGGGQWLRWLGLPLYYLGQFLILSWVLYG